MGGSSDACPFFAPRMTDTEPNHPSSRIEAEVGRARSLLEQRRFPQALAAAEKLLAVVPENRDVLYLIAVSRRYLGRLEDALATLRDFERLHPDYGRLFQERGHCYRTLGDSAAAITAYRRAVQLNPALPASWKALQALCQATGQMQDARSAASLVAALESLPPPLVTASSMLAEGEIYPAERLVRQFMLAHPDHVEGMRLLARIGVKLDVL